VDALVDRLPVELGDGVEELRAPGLGVAGQVLAGQLLQRRAFLAVGEMPDQGPGGDLRARADQGDQLGQQVDARLARATKRDGGASSSANEGCCSSSAIALRTTLRRGGASGRLPWLRTGADGAAAGFACRPVISASRCCIRSPKAPSGIC